MIKCKLNISDFCATFYRVIWPLLFLFSSKVSYAQKKDTLSVDLTEIKITSVITKPFGEIKKIQMIDSVNRQNFFTHSIADLLAVNSTLFIKNYGPSALSSVSLRGGNASQTPVLWNGLNIQNPMLGQNDFSQLPSFVFDRAVIEYGGSSALWGSGAMGGSIHLTNKATFNNGLHTLLNVGLGSFDTKKLQTQIHLSNEKLYSNTKVYYYSSLNNFNYLDTNIKQQIHADYNIKGVLQEIGILPAAHQKINLRAWYNQSYRNLPPLIGKKISKSSQADENLKITADWSYEGKKIIPALRVAFFDDLLNYSDSIANIYSNNHTKTIITEADVNLLINPSHRFFAGINYTHYKAITTNYYSEGKELNKQSVIAGYYFSRFQNKLKYELQIRQEFSNAFKIPLTGNTGLSYQLLQTIKLKVNAAKVYRLPTMNDLYWINGGNPNLKPEDGYTYEGGFEFKFNTNAFLIESEMTYFNKNIFNWISWIPGPGGYPQATNLLHVYSRGTETSSGITYRKKDIRCKIGFNTAYVLSSSVKSELINDESVNKQLIYTPRYNYGAHLNFTLYRLVIAYYHNYIGYRFTSSDNSTWLTPYHVACIKIAYSFILNHAGITSAFSINNLFNQNYMVVAQRPMPLRSYEVSITLNYHKQKSKNKS